MPPRTQRENLLTRLRARQHEVGALQEVAERRAGVWRGGAPDGAQRAVGDGGVRGEVGGEVPEIGSQVDGGRGGLEEGADGIGCCDGEARRGGGRRHGWLQGTQLPDGEEAGVRGSPEARREELDGAGSRRAPRSVSGGDDANERGETEAAAELGRSRPDPTRAATARPWVRGSRGWRRGASAGEVGTGGKGPATAK